MSNDNDIRRADVTVCLGMHSFLAPAQQAADSAIADAARGKPVLHRYGTASMQGSEARRARMSLRVSMPCMGTKNA